MPGASLFQTLYEPPTLDDSLATAVELHRRSPANDAFGRSRVGLPATLFASSHEYNDSPLFWQTVTTGTGAAPFVAATASVNLSVAADGDSVIRQTYRYMRYLPGKSQLVLLTGVVGAGVTNVTKRWGYFDNGNGLFFQQDGDGTLSVVRRSSATGSPVDTAVAQANWNIDPMDGTGPSGKTLNVSKANIFVIDFEWLGVGRQRYGVNIDGMTYYVHETLWANANDDVYMTTANLPVRYEIVAAGVPGGTATMKQICSTVVSEGGSDAEMQSRIRSVNNGVTGVSVATRRAILTVRPKATFEGRVNRALIEPLSVEFINTGNSAVLVELVRNGTLGGTPSFTSAGTTSAVEYDVAGTTVTGGEVLWSGYVATANQGGRLNLPFDNVTNADIPLTLDYAGANPTNLSVVVTSFGAATACAASVTWKEVY